VIGRKVYSKRRGKKGQAKDSLWIMTEFREFKLKKKKKAKGGGETSLHPFGTT